MTDAEFLDGIAKALDIDGELIKAQVELYRRQGIAKLYARTKPFWIKARGELSMAVGDYLKEMRAEFPDFWQVRQVRTATGGKLDIMSEGRFRQQFPDDTLAGTPSIVIPLDAEWTQFYPRADTAITLYVSYFWSPGYNTITEIPPQWQHVVEDYVLAMLWPNINEKAMMLKFFQIGLDDVAAMAKPITQDDIDIEPDPLAGVIYPEMSEER